MFSSSLNFIFYCLFFFHISQSFEVSLAAREYRAKAICLYKLSNKSRHFALLVGVSAFYWLIRLPPRHCTLLPSTLIAIVVGRLADLGF